MGEYDLTNTTINDPENNLNKYEVSPKQTDGVSDQEETEYQNNRWSIQWGYFNTIPELKNAILMKAIWIVGKGYEADNRTNITLDALTGWGKDNFTDLLFNMEVIKRVGGDAYAEIIRDETSNELLNIKPLDPGSIKIIVDGKGIIKRYEQTNKLGPNNKKGFKTFQPDQIFHLSNNRLADQIHGLSDIDALEEVIKADQENFEDMKAIMHNQAKPLIMFKLGTDDQNTIDQFVTKMDAARNRGSNVYIPDDKDAVSFEVVQVNVSSIIFEWRNDLRNKFYRSVGLPQIVPGGGGQSTESESKVIYFAFEQIVQKDQKHLEEQIKDQLTLEIKLYPPATLAQDLNKDESKDPQAFQPSDTTVGVGR